MGDKEQDAASGAVPRRATDGAANTAPKVPKGFVMGKDGKP